MKNLFEIVRSLRWYGIAGLVSGLAGWAPWVGLAATAAAMDPALVALHQRSFVEGREYFVLRSGRAKLIAQADRVDLGPAWLYLLFDAEDNAQSARKARAFNFGEGPGFLRSGLQVELGGFAFTALGHQTQTRWTTHDGIPCAEAVWWAGGLRVTERLLGLGGDGLFLRRVDVASVHLGGPATVKLRLTLPPGKGEACEGWIVQDRPGCRLALGVSGESPAQAILERGELEVGPLTVAPGESVSADTLLLAQIPPRGDLMAAWSPIPVSALPRPAERSAAPTPSPIWVEPVGTLRTETHWARPGATVDRVFENILVGYGEALRFRVCGVGSGVVTLVWGWCEGFHGEPGQRVMTVRVEDQRRHRVDPVAAVGMNQPLVWACEARDENGDGWIDLAVDADASAKDRNPILNALWVFEGTAPVAQRIVDGTSNAKAVAFVHALQPGTSPPGQPLGRLDARGAMARGQAAWRGVSSVQTDDVTVQEIFDKVRFGLPAMVADNGVMDAGIFEYGAQWVRDTSNTLLGLIHAGHFELARRGLEHVLTHMINAEGNAMIAGSFDDPDREQFDQMGELLHALKAYRDWTGDDALVQAHRTKLVALIERPLLERYRDDTGMVHNRREFWERTLEDAYELAYQTYVVLGLREAVALAESLGAVDRVDRWRAEADRIQQAMLRHPRRALVDDGHLIKRRSVNGQRVRTLRFPPAAPDVPLRTESVNLAEPDATMALPIAFGLVDPKSALAGATLDELEKLWNARWFGGGYERYHSSGQCDQPGPWTFASCFILRAQHEAGRYAHSRRTLEWLNTVQGGRTGAWFEEIPLVRSQAPTAGIIPWTSGELSLFIVRHLLGVRFEGTRLVIRPALYPGSPAVRADLRFRTGRLQLEIPSGGRLGDAEVEGQRYRADADGTYRLPEGFTGGRVMLRVESQ